MTVPYRHIRGFVIGNKAQIIRDPVLNIASGRFVDRAWFTLKGNITDGDSEALLLKEISETGTDDGIIDTDSAGSVRLTFNLLPADWVAAGIQEGTIYVHEITVEEVDDNSAMTNPETYTVELGDFAALGPVLQNPV